MDEAARSNRIVASPIQRFSESEYVVLRYLVVRNGPRATEVAGFLGAPIRLERLVAQLSERHPKLQITLGGIDDSGQLQLTKGAQASDVTLDPDLSEIKLAIDAYQRQWTLQIAAQSSFHPETILPRWLAIPSVVMVLTLLSAGLLMIFQRSDTRARQLATQMTRVAVTQREIALQSQSQHRLLLELVPIGVMHVGTDHCIVSANRMAHQTLGYREGELVGKHMSVLHDHAEVERRCADLSRHLNRPVTPSRDLFYKRDSEGRPYESEWKMRRQDGSLFSAAIICEALIDEHGEEHGSVRVFSDISERERRDEQIRWLASHDALTGLPNRFQLEQHANALLQRPTGSESALALLLLDLDRFKQINDTLGHSVGDEVLREVARRLQTCVRPTDLVVRMGGDEFVILLQAVNSERDARTVAAKVIHQFVDEMQAGEYRLRLTTSIGIALYPDAGTDLANLLKAADLAMYRAKASGRNKAALYDPVEDRVDALRLQLERDLGQALSSGQMEVHYQPIVAAQDSLPVGMEALIRWRHPKLGLVSPGDFIPIAEETGDIIGIGRWVLETGCKDIMRLRARWPDLRLSVNLSGRQIALPEFDAQVVAILADSGLPPAALELEITESLLVQSNGEVPSTLRRLRRLGIGLAVDDFGTGYSALAYLDAFPVTTLKVDRSFVQQFDTPAAATLQDTPGRGGALTLAIIAMARSLGLKTTAEGVETDLQRTKLAQANCDCLQGFYFGRVVPIQEAWQVLEELSDRSARLIPEQMGPMRSTL